MYRSLTASAFVLLYLVSPIAAQQVIFNDDFSLDPGSNGWTESIVTTNTATGDIVPTGTAAEVDKTGGTGRVEGRITRFFDTTGFSDVTLEFFAFQSATSFEGGAITSANTDSLSIYIDTGSGFAPLFQRSGVWGTTGPGFVDGGTGAGNVVSTSSGTFSLNAAAANNAALGIAIEGIVSAAAESYFFDDFFLRGTQIPNNNPNTPGPARGLVTDAAAVASFFAFGLPAVAAMGDASLGSIQSARRDINERLFRLRSGLGTHAGSSLRSPVISDEDAGPVQVSLDPATPWHWYAQSDFGRQRIDSIGGEFGKSGETNSGSVGFEYSGGNNLAMGMAWSYLESDYRFSGGAGGLDTTGHQVHVYASWLPTGNSYVSALYSFSDLKNQIHRNTGLGSMAYGDTDGIANSISLDGGYHIRLGDAGTGVVTGPYLGLDYTDGQIDGFSETGNARGALDVFGQEYESLVSKIGWQASKSIQRGNVRITPQIRAAWEREHEGPDDSVSARLQQSPFLLTQGNQLIRRVGGFGSTLNQSRPGRDYLSAGGGLRFVFDNAWTLSVDYEGHFFRDNASAHYGGLRLSGGF